MASIKVSNLTFSYFGSPEKIFEDVSFQIDTNWKLGFIGRNGRGKTTFLNLLLDKYEYSGKIITPVKFKYFPQIVQDKTLNTIEVISVLNPDFQLWQLERELSLLEVSEEVLYRSFDTLSNGEQSKLLLASLFLDDDNFLLIDEPTNHLDYKAREIVSRYLKSKKGFILVSHDRTLLDSCINHVLSINKSNIEIQNGNFSSWYYNRKLQDEFELAENEKLKKEMKRLDKSIKRTAGWANQIESSKYGNGPVDRGFIGHKSAKMMKRAKSIESRRQALIDEKSKLLKNIEETSELKINPLRHHSNNLISFENVAIFYDKKLICQNINFNITNGNRVSLRGKNGSGKTSVLKLICGENISFTGDFHKSSNLTISYVPQDTSFLSGNLRDYANMNNIDETLFKTILRKLDFSREQFDKDMRDYSAGQKKKVLIAKSLCESAHIYIWDEPLNYIDVLSRIQIENLLLNSSITLLFVEHDIKFTDNLATHIINLE